MAAAKSHGGVSNARGGGPGEQAGKGEDDASQQHEPRLRRALPEMALPKQGVGNALQDHAPTGAGIELLRSAGAAGDEKSPAYGRK